MVGKLGWRGGVVAITGFDSTNKSLERWSRFFSVVFFVLLMESFR